MKMNNFLAIVILYLLFCSSSFAKEIDVKKE